MNAARRTKTLVRKDDRIIIHFDHDSFYAQVFENENPALRGLPLGVQQKNIIVTCNYEARRRGLHKLQLISEAKKLCPDVIIVLGEQLDRFRDASKTLYKYLEGFTWNKKIERLGFDEVFMDVTDIVSYNKDLLNPNDLSHAFFQLSRDDPTVGFTFDATGIAGHGYPDDPAKLSRPETEGYDLLTRLILGSHLAEHLRHSLEQEQGYTSTVGISTSKLLAKLVGNLHKPRNQTTLMPPYERLSLFDKQQSLRETISTPHEDVESNVTKFMDAHDIGRIPGIGFKMSHKIRCHVLSRPAIFDAGLIYGGTKESVTVRDVRLHPEMGPELLDHVLGGPGSEKGIGYKAWTLINGIDDSEVSGMKKIPTQISIEDSYIRLNTIPQVYKELRILSTSLLKRMHVDLLEDDDGTTPNPTSHADEDSNAAPSAISTTAQKWIAHPKTIRLTTRPRPPLNGDGTRSRSFNRISRSGPLPHFIFNLHEGVDVTVEKLVRESLIPMFHRLHPEKDRWNLSLMNVGVTNMAEAASEDRATGGGRDIGRMFRRQEEVLREWKVVDRDVPPEQVVVESGDGVEVEGRNGEKVERGKPRAEPSIGDETVTDTAGAEAAWSEDVLYPTQNTVDEEMCWEEDDDVGHDTTRCEECGARMPSFATSAHERFHALGDR